MKTKLNKQKIIDKYCGGLINYLLVPFKGSKTNHSVIIYKLDAIGDAVLSLPMIKYLKEQTNFRIIIACSKSNLSVFKNHKFIDKILIFNSSKLDIKDLIKNIKELRKEKARFSIDTAQSSNISAIISFITAKQNIGFKKTKGKSRNHIYVYPIELDPNKHMIYNYFDLLKPLGINTPKKVELVSLNKKKFPKKEKVVAVHPCNIFPYKYWSKERWVEIIEYLALKNEVLILGSKEESPMVKELLENVKSKRVLNLSGRTNINDLIKIMPKFKLLIGLDGGLMHIASSMQISTVSLFGHVDPIRYAPFNKKSIALYNPPLCSPCVKNYDNQETKCTNPICFDKISVKDVKEAIDKLI